MEMFDSFSPDWQMPDRIGHLDLEVVQLSPDDVSTGPVMVPGPNGPVKKTDTPLIIVEGERSLDEQEGQLVLSMNDLYETAKVGIVQRRMNCNPAQAEYLLRKLIDRIEEDTGWNENQILMNLLVRDFFEPNIVEGHVKFPSDLEDTFRLYYVEDGAIVRWSSIPYHAASLKLGDVIHKDLNEDGFGEDYPDGEWDTGDPM